MRILGVRAGNLGVAARILSVVAGNLGVASRILSVVSGLYFWATVVVVLFLAV